MAKRRHRKLRVNPPMLRKARRLRAAVNYQLGWLNTPSPHFGLPEGTNPWLSMPALEEL